MKSRILKAVFSLLFLTGLLSSSSQILSPQWALQIGGLGDDRGVKIITDTSGNIYFTGILEKEVSFSSNGIFDTINSYGKEDIYFGKINPTGQLLWSKHIGGKSTDVPTDLMINGNGDVYLSGIFEDTLFIEFDTIISQDYIDSFIAKFDASGNYLWLRQIAGIGNQQCVSLVSDLAGNLLTVGSFTKSLEFPQSNSQVQYSIAGFDGFFAKWTPQGDLSWVKLIQGNGKTIIKDIMIDEFNDYYLTGDFTDSISIEGSQSMIYSVGNTDVVLIKYLNNGSFSWVKSVGSIYDDKAKCLTIGGNGKMIMIGEFKENLFYSNHVILSAEGGDDIFQITFNKNGNIQHHKKQGLDKNDFVFDAWVPIGQKIIMASDLRINEGQQNTSIATYGLLGDICDVYQTGIDYNPTVLSTLMTDEDHIYYCGNFHGTVTFDQLSLTSKGDEDMFLIKMAPEEVMLNLTQSDSILVESEPSLSQFNQLSINNFILQTETETETQTDIFYNYPNPFRNNTQIIYSLPETCCVSVKIIDVNGKIVKEWQFLSQSFGEHVLDYSSEVFQSGLFTCKLVAQGKSVFISKSIKMICVN